MKIDFSVLVQSLPELVNAAVVTLELVVASALMGIALAAIIVAARLGGFKILNALAWIYVWFFRGTPLLVQLFLFYYGSGQFADEFEQWGLWQYFREPTFCALLALTLNTAAYTSEILRAQFTAVPYSDRLAAASLGLSRWQTFRAIVLPRVLFRSLPAYGNEFILLLKASSLVSTITILDLMGVTRQLVAKTYAPIEVFLAAGVVYWALVQAAGLVFQWAEWRWGAWARWSKG